MTQSHTRAFLCSWGYQAYNHPLRYVVPASQRSRFIVMKVKWCLMDIESLENCKYTDILSNSLIMTPNEEMCNNS